MDDHEVVQKVKDIMHYHVGKERAINRWELVRRVYDVTVPTSEQNDDHPLDRDIRYAVARLRAQGHFICDLGDGNGRWIAKDENEFWEFYFYYIKPIRTRADVARSLKEAAKRKWPNILQPSLFNFDDLEVV